MGNAKTIEVGNKSDAPYFAFGDDSQFENVLTYAFVIVRRTRLTKIEREISWLKKRFKIPQGTPIHCRVLFHHHPRHKAGLGHLTDEDAQKIVAHAITILNETKCLIRYATGSLSAVLGIEKSTLELRHESDGTTVSVAVKPEPKGVLGMLMQMCFAVDPNGSQGPHSSQCEIFAAADPTKIQFVGPRKGRADGHYFGYSDVGAPAGSVFQLQPKLSSSGETPLLQLADIVAYICSHSTGHSGNNKFYREQKSRFAYWVQGTMVKE